MVDANCAIAIYELSDTMPLEDYYIFWFVGTGYAPDDYAASASWHRRTSIPIAHRRKTNPYSLWLPLSDQE